MASVINSSKNLSIYSAFIWHGFFLALTMSMIDFTTVLPSLLSELSRSKIFFGLLYSVLLGAPGIFNLFFSHFLEPKKKKKGFLLAGIYLRAFSFLGMAVFVFLLGRRYPALVMISLFFWIFIFATSGGFASLAYTDIIGKMTAKGERGRLYALREIAAGVAALGGGLLVNRIFGSGKIPYPMNYSIALFIGFLGLVVASFGFWGLQEKPSLQLQGRENLSFLTKLKQVPQYLREDLSFTRFIVVENLTSFSLMIIPFYMIYAKDILKAGKNYVGRYLLMVVAGTIISNLFWGFIAEQQGSKAVVRHCIFLGGLIPVLALLMRPYGPGWFSIIFVLVGFIQSGREVGFDPYLLDIIPEERRTTYLGIRGTLNLLVVLLPVLGGVFIEHLGYRFTFVMVTVIMFAAFGLMSGMKRSIV